MKIAIVAPCHIPPTKDWIYSLQREARLGGADVIIVDDSDGKLGDLPKEWRVCNYSIQKGFLGDLYEDFAKMFHKSSACRIFGHILAFQEKYEVIIGLDSDCIVPFHFVQQHIAKLNAKASYGWTNPIGGSGMYSRGFPYSMRDWPIKANMGMWENVLDINGKDRRKDEPRKVNAPGSATAPAPLPFSGMNFALTRDVMWGFLFLPNFDSGSDKFRRIDDVWGGYVFQKLLHRMKNGVIYGQPVVFHDTIVIPAEDAAEEEAMYKHEDEFIADVDSTVENMSLVVTPQTSMSDLMLDFIMNWERDVQLDPSYQLTPAFQWWEKVIQKYAQF